MDIMTVAAVISILKMTWEMYEKYDEAKNIIQKMVSENRGPTKEELDALWKEINSDKSIIDKAAEEAKKSVEPRV